MRSNDLRAFGFFVQKIIDFGNGPVEGDHGESVIVHVKDQVLAHYRQPDQRNISSSFHKIRFGLSKTFRVPAATLGLEIQNVKRKRNSGKLNLNDEGTRD